MARWIEVREEAAAETVATRETSGAVFFNTGHNACIMDAPPIGAQ